MPRVRVLPYRPEKFETASVHRRAVTPLQALMEAAPFEEPGESVMERWGYLDVVNEAMEEALDEREFWVIQALFWRRLTLRQLGRELSLSKTQVARIRDQAIEKLAVALVQVADEMES